MTSATARKPGKNKRSGKSEKSAKAPRAKAARPAKPTMAEKADRHALYQVAVQDVVAEIDFVDEQFRKARGRDGLLLREDFCGTANTSCEWVRRRKTNRAIGVDIDPAVLQWGRENNLPRLKPAERERVTLVQDDVLKAATEPVDILLAMNFSYWLFDKREQMLRYFERCRENLKADGIMFLDSYGGWDAHREIREPRDCEKFDYVWDQAAFDPISGRMTCYIHFKFPDGSKLKRAFEYHWRLWSLPELHELLLEAGFRRVRFFWEGADDDTGDGNGEFEEVTSAESDPGWICYIMAER